MAQPFDAARGQTVGEVLPVAGGVSFTSVLNYAPIAVSETGVLLYKSGGAGGPNQLAWFDRGGKLLGTVGTPGPVYTPALSLDEKSVVFSRISGSGSGLWLLDLGRGVEQRFTTDASVDSGPVWSPNGDRIVFASQRGSAVSNLYQKAASGSGQDELLLTTGNTKTPSQWSRDGRFIVYSELDSKTKRGIWVLPMEEGRERKAFLFLHSESNEFEGQLSPDSHWMAYTSDESGQPEVYVRSFPTGELQKKISLAGGDQPWWRADGKELFFVGADGKIVAVPVNADPGAKPFLEPGAPKPLFDGHLSRTGGTPIFQYNVTSDGKRFLLVTTGAASPALLNVVMNWDAGLEK
jgi:Tol biopolymer transport system component